MIGETPQGWRRTREARTLWSWLCAGAAGWTLACGGPAANPPRGARAADQLQMRKPDDLASPSDAQVLGAFRPVAAKVAPERAAKPKSDARAAPPPAIRVARGSSARPYALRDRELVLPSGLTVHHVPNGVAIRTVEDEGGGPVWEFIDVHGRRLALLKEQSWRRAAASEAPLLEESATARTQATRGDWAKAPVRVVVDRFRSDKQIYTLERRASGTDWIWSGLEFSK